jgi:hypothetical protein
MLFAGIVLLKSDPVQIPSPYRAAFFQYSVIQTLARETNHEDLKDLKESSSG